MNRELLEVYSDYLLSSFSYTTATGLSALTGGVLSHDKITRFLNSDDFGPKHLWQLVKPHVRRFERDDGVLIIDDTVEEKPYTDESELVCWHYDHSQSKSVKGINLVNVLYESLGLRIPVNYVAVEKTEWEWDKKTKRWKRKSAQSKNEHARTMLTACMANAIKFRYVLADSWYASAETMRLIHEDLKRYFVMPVKLNRRFALSKEDKEKGRYQSVESLTLEPNKVYLVYVEQLDFPLLLVKQVFKNEDGREGVLYLVTNDVTLDYAAITTLYQRRWSVETYHESIKGNASLAKSPTKTKRTQKNHIFAAVYAFVKLELLSVETKLNHVAIRSRLYLKALQASAEELKRLRAEVRTA
jgi:hypothetical protein